LKKGKLQLLPAIISKMAAAPFMKKDPWFAVNTLFTTEKNLLALFIHPVAFILPKMRAGILRPVNATDH